MAAIIVPLTAVNLVNMNARVAKDAYLMLADSYNEIINNEVMHCAKCDEWKVRSEFYDDFDYASEKFPICKECLLELAEDHNSPNEAVDITEDSLKRVLRLMDLPFFQDVFDEAMKTVSEKSEKPKGKYDYLKKKEFSFSNVFNYYMKAVRNTVRSKDAQHWIDGEMDGEITDVKLRGKLKAETLNRFGQSYSQEELLFLQNEYDDWVKRYECNTKAQEECFQRLATTKLEIVKATRKGKSTKDLEASYKTWMDSANVTPKQNSVDTTSQAQTFGTLIQKFEMENPIPEPDPDLKDPDRILELMEVVLGHTCEAAGVKSGYNQAYQRFMKEYTVKKQEYEEDNVNNEIYSQFFGDES